MRRFLTILAVLALAPFALAACGGDDDDDGGGGEETAATTDEETTGGGGGETVSVSAAEEGLAFQESSLSAAAGTVTFEFENPSGSTPHDFCIEQDGSEVGCTETITGDSDTLEADLESGEYVFYCSVAGHREAGMEGPLTVE
jgi:plastocyanin